MTGPDRPIFIVGCPRSGTTLFRTMLHAHPRLAVPPETRFVMPAYNSRFSFGDLRERRNRDRLARWIVERDDSRFAVLELDGPEMIEQIVAGPPTLGSAFGLVFRAYSAKHGKARWGDKRPAYYSFIDELDQLFPDAQFIHVVRDGRACVASLKKTPWFGHDPIACMATWMMAIDCCREAASWLGRERYLEVRYEDLVADPEQEMRKACAFLDEEFAAEMCEPEKIAARVNPAHYQQREQISRGIYRDALQSWREQLAEWEVSVFEAVAGERLRRHGYELSGTTEPPPQDRVRALVAEHRKLSRALARRRQADRRRLVDADSPVAAQLTTGQLAAASGRPPKRPLVSHVRRSLRPVVRRLRPLYDDARRLVPGSASRSAAPNAERALDNIEET